MIINEFRSYDWENIFTLDQVPYTHGNQLFVERNESQLVLVDVIGICKNLAVFIDEGALILLKEKSGIFNK